jgi:RNA polymerase-binding transcription factor DksA
MATKKKNSKTPPKKAAKPIKKSAPAKKAAPKKVVKKAVAKKPVVKKSAPKKIMVKKPVPKKVAKPVAKKPAPVKKAAPAKKVAAPVKKSVPVKKTVLKYLPKVESKRPVAKSLPIIAPQKVIKPKEVKGPSKPVVIPKITTKTVRKYHPDFTKSVLDRPKLESNMPSTRYSDAELSEFRDIITRKLEAAKKELAYLNGIITRKDEMGGDETDNRYMTMEDGSLSMEREQLNQMASRQITFIDHLEKAMMRIENKTYGICRVTGRLIDKARLRAVPHATLSIEAKMGNIK